MNTVYDNHFIFYCERDTVAKKPKLNQGQKRRVAANHQRRLAQNDVITEDSDLGPLTEGLVVSRFGKQADVEGPDQQIIRCHLRRTIVSVVTGDRVLWRAEQQPNASEMKGVIEAVHPRHSVLSRPDFYDGIKPVAANIDQVVIVSAVRPEFSTNIVDRYLVAAEHIEIPPLLILNKIDLLSAEERAELETKLQIYRNLDYPFICVSCETGEGLDALQSALKDKTSVFVGQSGVGKSSLVNQLHPEAKALTGLISEQSQLGQHTTTTARLYHFANGGLLIDSPGIREFALWHLENERVTWCFKEFRNYLGGCKFSNCKHGNDPGCLIRQAVEDGEIAAERYENYRRILESMQNTRSLRHTERE